jgi:predicted regulator of Ras-like GTPase activity (Roadblock/LC7/MglB family)
MMPTDEAKLDISEAEMDKESLSPPPPMTDVLLEILTDLHRSTTDIVLSMIASRDGLAMITHGSMEDEDHAAAVCAELLAQCQQAAGDFRIGSVNLLLARCREGYALILPASDDVMLAMIARTGSNIGYLLLEGERAAEAVAAAL